MAETKKTKANKAPAKTVKKAVKPRRVKTAKKTAAVTAPKTASVQSIKPNVKREKSMEITMTQGTQQFEKMAQDATAMQREAAEAFMQSGNIFFRGFEEIVRTATTMAQESAEKQAQFAKEALGAKNLNDFAAIQNKIAQSNMDDFMAGATKLTELSVKVLTESSEPVNRQMTKTMNTARKAA